MLQLEFNFSNPKNLYRIQAEYYLLTRKFSEIEPCLVKWRREALESKFSKDCAIQLKIDLIRLDWALLVFKEQSRT